MQKSLILGGILGGLVLFIWGFISYMVLPWHRRSPPLRPSPAPTSFPTPTSTNQA